MKLLLLSILISNVSFSLAEDKVDSLPVEEESEFRVRKIKDKNSLERARERDEALEEMRRKETSSPNTFLKGKRKMIKIPTH